MQIHHRFHILVGMMGYGTILGGTAGFLSALALILTSGEFHFVANLPLLLLEILAVGLFGMIFGGIFGTFAGIASGIAMSLVTALFFKDIPSHLTYRSAMGLVTMGVTGIFFFDTLRQSRIDGIDLMAWDMTIAMAIVIAMYASQRVAERYLFEWSIRKMKAVG